MANLKTLRDRIKSIKATQKITGAMKMVAASRFRQNQDSLIKTTPYTQKFQSMIFPILAECQDLDSPPCLLTGNNGPTLVIIVTSNRGLCGGFNSAIIRRTLSVVPQFQDFKVLNIGRKSRKSMQQNFKDYLISIPEEINNQIDEKKGKFSAAEKISDIIFELLETKIIGAVTIVHSVFKNALVQKIVETHLVPFSCGSYEPKDSYIFEPNQKELLPEILRENLTMQIYQILLETAVCEQAARMTAMDSATRNARDMIKKLELNYNRTRQAQITKELIEVISGAEAFSS